MTRHAVLVAALLCIGGRPAMAQASASFRISAHVLNAGGHAASGTVLSSSSFRITFDSIGDPLAALPMSSASFRLQPGFALVFPPPGEVSGLVFQDRQTLRWNIEPAVGSYNLYRGLVSTLPSLEFGTCEQEGIPQATTTDSSSPLSGQAFFYLVTAENLLTEEGTKGFQSNGTERQGNACP